MGDEGHPIQGAPLIPGAHPCWQTPELAIKLTSRGMEKGASNDEQGFPLERSAAQTHARLARPRRLELQAQAGTAVVCTSGVLVALRSCRWLSRSPWTQEGVWRVKGRTGMARQPASPAAVLLATTGTSPSASDQLIAAVVMKAACLATASLIPLRPAWQPAQAALSTIGLDTTPRV